MRTIIGGMALTCSFIRTGFMETCRVKLRDERYQDFVVRMIRGSYNKFCPHFAIQIKVSTAHAVQK